MILWRVAAADPDSAAAQTLIAAHFAHGAAHYPAESNHSLDATGLKAGGAGFFLGYDEAGRAQGMAAFVPIAAIDGAVEVKSMFVTDAARGRGLARAMIEHMLEAARQRGYRSAWLETGSRDASAAARGLYTAFGFTFCPPFAGYREDPESVFMMVELL